MPFPLGSGVLRIPFRRIESEIWNYLAFRKVQLQAQNSEGLPQILRSSLDANPLAVIMVVMLEIHHCPYCGKQPRQQDNRDWYCESCDLTFYVVFTDEYRIDEA